MVSIKEPGYFVYGDLNLRRNFSRLCLQTMCLLEAAINKEWREIVRLSRLTFKEICQDLRPFLDKKALVTRACH